MQRMTTSGPTIAAAAVLPALRALRLEGVDTGPITESLVNEGALTVERRIRYAVASPLWEKAATMLNDPLLGLRCSADLSPTSFGITSLLALSSPTLGEALRWPQAPTLRRRGWTSCTRSTSRTTSLPWRRGLQTSWT